MTQATVVLVGDRLHAINQLLSVSGYITNARRYFPTSFDTARLPLLVPLALRQDISVPQAGGGIFNGVRTWEIRLYAGEWMMGVPSESAQKIAEACIDPLIALYVARPRLELDHAPLDGVQMVTLQTDSGITSDETGTLALVRLPLLIQARYVF